LRLSKLKRGEKACISDPKERPLEKKKKGTPRGKRQAQEKSGGHTDTSEDYFFLLWKQADREEISC